MKPLHKASIGYALLAILLWSTVATAFKIALAGMTPLQLLFIATWTSTAVLTMVLLWQGKVQNLVHQSRKDWLLSAGLGIIYPLVYYLLLFSAYDRLPAQQAQPLNYTWPVFFALLSVPFLGRTLSLGSIIGLLVSFSGVITVSTGGDPLHLKGLDLTGSLLALSSGAVWAVYWIQNLRDQRESIVKLTSGFFIGAIYVTLISALTSEPLPSSIKSVYCSIYVGVFEMGITFIFWMKALEEDHQEVLVGNLAFLTPFLSLVFIHFIVGEEICISSIIGLILIVSGIAIQTLFSQKER